MKKVFLFVVILVLGAASYAQVQVATLQHGDNIRMFYGTRGFVDAYDAAAAGDVINLSPGCFEGCEIAKNNLTIRGCGMEGDNATAIGENDYSYIYLSNLDTLTIEGIHTGPLRIFNATTNVFFSNVDMYELNDYYGGVSGQLVNCKGRMVLKGNSSPLLINCKITYLNCDDNSRPTIFNSFVNLGRGGYPSCVNCVVFFGYSCPTANFMFENCVLITEDDGIVFPATTYAQNCIGYSLRGNNNLFDYCAGSDNQIVNSSIFRDFSGNPNSYGSYYNINNNYALTDSAQATYLGDDGTQVGMYGGYAPYRDGTLSYPQITRFNVAKRITEDGKLSVEIGVDDTDENNTGNE